MTSLLVLLLLGLAGWQYREFQQENQLARQTLHRQAHTVMNALVGGIQSHRRRGRFFADQLEGSLTGLVRSADILAVGLAGDSADGWLKTAGQADVLPAPDMLIAGDYWRPTGFMLVEPFELAAATSGPHSAGGGGLGRFGRGPAAADAWDSSGESDGPFSAAGRYVAVLVLDRRAVDERRERAAWLRGSLAAVGSVLIVGLVLAWRVTVRAAGRARQLETEARHLREMGQAAAGLAHETRNPLGLIRGWAQRWTQAETAAPELRDQAASIVEECDRVTARINEFLSFARPRQPAWVDVDVRQLVTELAMLLEPDLQEQGVSLQVANAPVHMHVRADQEMLRQALFNLIRNAIDASPDNSAIEVFLRPGQDGRQRLEVADRGPGVPPQLVESLFAPYFTTRPEGTGLGLAIVRHIASLHGWQAGYAPRPGGGAVFWLDRMHA